MGGNIHFTQRMLTVNTVISVLDKSLECIVVCIAIITITTRGAGSRSASYQFSISMLQRILFHSDGTLDIVCIDKILIKTWVTRCFLILLIYALYYSTVLRKMSIYCISRTDTQLKMFLYNYNNALCIDIQFVGLNAIID